ncbi:MAG: OmpP1/FadL family transporter [bacterium]
MMRYNTIVAAVMTPLIFWGMMICTPAYSQGPHVLPTSPPVAVGSGARAQGMGGAFIAVADDATAASWNPGGLGQLQKPELSIVGRYFFRSEKYNDYVLHQEACDMSSLDLNYLSAAYAKTLWRRNVFFSLNYQKLFDFSRELKLVVPFEDPLDPDDGGLSETEQHIRFHQDGSLYTLSPALAVEIKPGLYLGLAYNVWSDHITGRSRWKAGIEIVDSYGPYEASLKFNNFQGESLTLGFLWKVSRQFHMGGVYKAPFQAGLDGEYSIVSKTAGGNLVTDLWKASYEIDFPAAYGLGFSYQISDSWILAGDVTRTEWQDYIISETSPYQEEVGPFAKYIRDPNGSIVGYYIPEKKPTYTVRLGVEYTKILDKVIIPFRFGVFYDPEPSVGSPQDFYGVSFGCGVVINSRIAIDTAYQYRFGREISGNELGFESAIPTAMKGEIHQHSFLSSLIYYF